LVACSTFYAINDLIILTMTQTERNSLENINRIKPIIDNARALITEHRYEEAYQSLLPYIENREVPDCFLMNCGWVIYYYLKLQKESHQSIELRKAFALYFIVCQPAASLLHSLVMVQAVSLEKKHENDFKFVEFCQMWHLDCLREEDFARQTVKTDDGKSFEYNSLAEDVATRLYKEMKQRHTSHFAKSLLPFMERVAQKCPQNKFVPMYVAQMWLWAGDREKAVETYQKILQNSPDWYLWKNLGEIVDDDDDRISFFCKALTMQGKEEFVGDLHLALARLLMDKNPQQALYEVNRYIDTYQRNNWRISDEVRVLADRLRGVAPETQPKAFYQANVERAEAFVYEGLPEVELTYTGPFKNSSGKMRAGLSGGRYKVSVGQGAFPELAKAEPGDVFRVRLLRSDHRWTVLTLHATGKKNQTGVQQRDKNQQTAQNSPTPEKKTVTGVVSLPRNGEFAFIDRHYYVPAGLRKKAQLQEGQAVTAQVVRQPDGKWRAVAIIP